MSLPHSELRYSLACNSMLAPYACFPEESRGRQHSDSDDASRSVFQRDRDRIIHSTAFRRLEYKTQVFVNHEGDHFRNRLTHSLEVAQLARSVARRLFLNEDLTEAIALAHDLGHPPFGHAGEDALNVMMQPYGGFDHNAQTLKVLTMLERRYAAFDGLNVTWECLEGVAKHNGPLVKEGHSRDELSEWFRIFDETYTLDYHHFPSLEAQLASLCDDVAYLSHDIEDGLRAGFFKTDELFDLPCVGSIFRDVSHRFSSAPIARINYEGHRLIIHVLLQNLVDTTTELLRRHQPADIAAVRHSAIPIVSFSAEMQREICEIKAFLYSQMYRHYKVNRMTSKARRIVCDLFKIFMSEPECLPPAWFERSRQHGSDAARAVVIADFIAGMTDRFAVREHQRLFDMHYRLIGD